MDITPLHSTHSTGLNSTRSSAVPPVPNSRTTLAHLPRYRNPPYATVSRPGTRPANNHCSSLVFNIQLSSGDCIQKTQRRKPCSKVDNIRGRRGQLIMDAVRRDGYLTRLRK